jgi:hypothetical protein
MNQPGGCQKVSSHDLAGSFAEFAADLLNAKISYFTARRMIFGGVTYDIKFRGQKNGVRLISFWPVADCEQPADEINHLPRKTKRNLARAVRKVEKLYPSPREKRD